MNEFEEDEGEFPAYTEQGVSKAREILDKTLDGYVLIALHNSQDLNKEITQGYFNGGRMQAIGLLDYFRKCLIEEDF